MIQKVKHPFFLTLFTSFFLLASCKDNPKKEQIEIVLSGDYPPFEYYKDGKLVGFEIDLMDHITKHLQKKPVYKDMPFESLIASLQSNRADLCISALSATKERRSHVDFSIPYHVSQSVIITFDQSKQDLSAFHGQTLGVQTGSTYEAFMKKQDKISLLSLSKIPDLIQALKTKRIQGIVLGLHEGKALTAHPQSENKETPLHLIELKETAVEYAIAFPKGSKLLEGVNNAIQKLTDDKTIETLVLKWFHELPQKASE